MVSIIRVASERLVLDVRHICLLERLRACSVSEDGGEGQRDQWDKWRYRIVIETVFRDPTKSCFGACGSTVRPRANGVVDRHLEVIDISVNTPILYIETHLFNLNSILHTKVYCRSRVVSNLNYCDVPAWCGRLWPYVTNKQVRLLMRCILTWNDLTCKSWKLKPVM